MKVVVWTILPLWVVCGRGGLSRLRRGGKTFGGLGLKGHPDGYLDGITFKINALKR